jgi:hypothetical protein
MLPALEDDDELAEQWKSFKKAGALRVLSDFLILGEESDVGVVLWTGTDSGAMETVVEEGGDVGGDVFDGMSNRKSKFWDEFYALYGVVEVITPLNVA